MQNLQCIASLIILETSYHFVLHCGTCQQQNKMKGLKRRYAFCGKKKMHSLNKRKVHSFIYCIRGNNVMGTQHQGQEEE